MTPGTPTLDARVSLLRHAMGIWLVEPLPALLPHAHEFQAYVSLTEEPDVVRQNRFVLSSRTFARTSAAAVYAGLLMFSIDARVGRALLHECAARNGHVLVCLGDGRAVSAMSTAEAVATILGDRRFRPLRLAAPTRADFGDDR
jgi:hypothetical protein